MSGTFILDGHTPVPIDDVIALGRWFGSAERRVARTDVTRGVYVSTVFLGLDHNFASSGPPLLFETMVFAARTCGSLDDFGQFRCSTWEQAERLHAKMVSEVKAELGAV